MSWVNKSSYDTSPGIRHDALQQILLFVFSHHFFIVLTESSYLYIMESQTLCKLLARKPKHLCQFLQLILHAFTFFVGWNTKKKKKEKERKRKQRDKRTNFHLHYDKTVGFAWWNFLLLSSLKTIKNSNGRIRRLYAYAVNDSTLGNGIVKEIKCSEHLNSWHF